ncbi:DUF5977 domain-containing protein [Hymenobacter sp. 15J16-1T3B]|uniref:DUF5977 domain-containing protein n=1 Tax=Hymenobacter sp. 15J16-1T3B TaxID=2886941 RepID=UPI001D103B2E|nr:DUF5977 domain-containing protein [Hymenobacter sp. 15J16-1T3B]MCC3159673.1 DUF5977 domain-containing protein [Hymenobacter sp. 15J16-1T3B]
MANTGRVEKQQRDMNPNSPTYGTVRWVDAGYTDLTACPLPTVFRSARISESVTRNDCPSGQFGSAVTYTLPDGYKTSAISQADADQQAQAYFDATKQAYANANGVCDTQQADQWAPLYYTSGSSEGCFRCLMYNTNDPSDVRAATEDEATNYFVAYNTTGTVPCGSCSAVINP